MTEHQLSQHQSGSQLSTTQPIAVVKVLSPLGVEYVFLTMALLATAGSLVAVLLLLVNNDIGVTALAVPTAILIVTLPIFSGLFLHLKKLELQLPALRNDASKRRSTQFTQILAFSVCVITTICFVYALFMILGGQSKAPLGKAALDALSVLGVAGSILFYYWRDEHKFKN